MSKKSKTQKRKEQEAEEKRIDALIPDLPEDYYKDENNYLRDKDGNRLPDGAYRDASGGVFCYEAAFLERVWE